MTANELDELPVVVEDQHETENAAGRGKTLRAALICFRDTGSGAISIEWTYWDTREQARQAEAELTPCCPQCISVHSVVRVDLAPAPPLKSSLSRILGTDGASR
jgi:hypothetical protein